jgi:peptidyl-tRNA hydrolase, PTH1 family
VAIQLVVGLGNPGEEYRGTRHNVGFEVVELLATDRWRKGFAGQWIRAQICGRPLMLLRPATYMNRSGLSVGHYVRWQQLGCDEIMVICDDLDLPLGRLRLRPSGSSGGHKGLESIGRELGTFDFARLRIGIGRPPEGCPPEEYVLSRFTAGERSLLEDVLDLAGRVVGSVVGCGVETAMNQYNGCDLTPAGG